MQFSMLSLKAAIPAVAALLALSTPLRAQSPTTPDPVVKDPTLPANASALHTVEGRGVQIYRCTQQDSNFQWTFVSPEATLVDPSTHQQVGTHGAGPSWTWKDGSTITGKVAAKLTSPEPTSVPWLLLSVPSAGTRTGELANVTMVRRSDTHGGNAPQTGCDASHIDAPLRVPYTATYTFYVPAH